MIDFLLGICVCFLCLFVCQLTYAAAVHVIMEQFVFTLSIRTHVLASRVTLEHIARQVSVWEWQTPSIQANHETISTCVYIL